MDASGTIVVYGVQRIWRSVLLEALAGRILSRLLPLVWSRVAVRMAKHPKLGRALGHFIFSLIGRKRILFTKKGAKLKAPPSKP